MKIDLINHLDLKTKILEQNPFINIENFPIPGFNFPDITYLLENEPELFRNIIEYLYELFKDKKIDYILCVESFGYVFGVPLAIKMGSKILLARKKGKLPRKTLNVDYTICYSNDRSLEIHKDIVSHNDNVLIVDDFLASGGTLKACVELLLMSNANIIGACFIAEIISFNARASNIFKNIPIESLYRIEFDEIQKSWKVS